MRRLFFVVFIMATLVMASCAPAAEAAVEEAPAAELTSGEITIAGSTTVQPLAELFSEAFSTINSSVVVDVQGGGSSVGVKAAGQDTSDIGMASREIKDSELEEFTDLVIHTIARDGIALVVNADVSVDDMSLEDARAVFAGEITNWSEVGGADEPIIVVSREEGSGTRGAFEEMVMDEALISENAILQPSNGSVRTTVSTTPASIGYISFGYLDDTTKPVMIAGVAPTEENAANGSYSVVRPLNMLTNGEPEGIVADFIDFIFSEAGQAIVAEEGYLPVGSADAEEAAAEEEAAPALSGEITVAGSTTVQPLAGLFSESFSAANADVIIDVQGGGSSVGVKAAGQGTSDIGMASREIKDSELEEFTNLVIFTIARDGIAVVVNADIAVDDMTLEQAQKIFAGEITNWSEVGGADESIIVVSREEGSGTRAAFEEMVMGKELLISENAILQPSNGSVRTTVSTTPASIGFLSFGYLDDDTKPVMIDGVQPNEENAANGSYAVVRPLNMLTNGEPEGIVKAFLDFIMSEAGQAIVADEGYLPVK